MLTMKRVLIIYFFHIYVEKWQWQLWLYRDGCPWREKIICLCLILSFYIKTNSKSLVSLDMLLVDFSMTREKPQNATHPKALSSNCFQSSFDVQNLKPFLKSFKLLSRLLFLNYYFFTTIIPLKLLTGKQTGVADC